jgi:hypothetical protein
MGRKGVSKRKPKKSGSNDKNNNHGSSNPRPGESLSPVRSLVNANDAPPSRDSTNPSAGSNLKKTRKGR